MSKGIMAYRQESNPRPVFGRGAEGPPDGEAISDRYKTDLEYSFNARDLSSGRFCWSTMEQKNMSIDSSFYLLFMHDMNKLFETFPRSVARIGIGDDLASQVEKGYALVSVPISRTLVVAKNLREANSTSSRKVKKELIVRLR